MSKGLRRLAVAAIVVAYFSVFFMVLRSLSHAKREVAQRPNCALVDAAVQRGVAPPAGVVIACRASARGLIESLTQQDIDRLRNATR